MARSTTVIASIISGGKSVENITVDSVSWSTDNGTITLSATVPGTVVIGDTITDSGGNSYLITNISGSDLTCQDFDSTTDPATGAGTIQEAYQNIADWEADLDDTTIYTSGDDVIGECYADANFTAGATINGGTTVGLSSIELTAAEGEANDGTSGTGVRIVQSSLAPGIYTIYGGSPGLTVTVSDIEVDMNGYNHYAFFANASGTVNTDYVHNFHRCIGHNVGNDSNDSLIFCQVNRAWVRFLNCIAYDANQSTGSSRTSFGFGSDGGGTNGKIEAYNCTAYGIVNNTSYGVGAGFHLANIFTRTAVNCISCDTSGSSSAIYDYYTVSDSYSLSSDATATGTGSLINKSSADQFISTVDGSEDLRLKLGADAIDVGNDVGTSPSGVEISINGIDRDAKGYVWDMGAYQYVLLRSVDVITSIISGGKIAENVTISSVDWNDDAGVITLSASVPAGVNIGDTITDNGSNTYLIFAIDGSNLHCQDFDTTTDPVTGSATIQEAYQSITAWEADLDDTIIYRSGDNAVGECYADADFDEAIVIDGGDTVGISTFKLTAPESERHDGTVGTGVCIASSSVATNGFISISPILSIGTVSWLEMDGSNSSRCSGIQFSGGSNARDKYIANNIIHDMEDYYSYGVYTRMYFDPYVTYIINNIIYNIDSKYTSGSNSYGIRYRYNNAIQYIANNTVHNIFQVPSGTGNSYGIGNSEDASQASTIIINNIATDCDDGDFYGGADATKSYNISSDATASGTGAVTNVTTADQYVSTTGGSEDLRLKSGSDAIDAGSDLGTTVDGIEFDINGRNRDAEGDTWDIGAHQYVTVGSSIEKDLIFNLSYLLALNEDGAFNTSSLLSLYKDSVVNQSNLLNISSDSVINTASGLNLELNSTFNTSTFLLFYKDGVLNTANLLSLYKDGVLNAATLLELNTNNIVNISNLTSLYKESTFNCSSFLGVVNDAEINISNLLQLNIDSILNDAVLASLNIDSVLNNQTHLLVVSDSTLNNCYAAGIEIDSVVPLSWLGVTLGVEPIGYWIVSTRDKIWNINPL